MIEVQLGCVFTIEYIEIREEGGTSIITTYLM